MPSLACSTLVHFWGRADTSFSGGTLELRILLRKTAKSIFLTTLVLVAEYLELPVVPLTNDYFYFAGQGMVRCATARVDSNSFVCCRPTSKS